jgi:hypothetical protein
VRRHPALVPLSRDHHRALVIAQQLRRATSENTTEVARAFLAHWATEEKHHFRLEEELPAARLRSPRRPRPPRCNAHASRPYADPPRC